MDPISTIATVILAVMLGFGAARMGINAHQEWIKRVKLERKWLQDILRDSVTFGGIESYVCPPVDRARMSREDGKLQNYNPETHHAGAIGGQFGDLTRLVRSINYDQRYGGSLSRYRVTATHNHGTVDLADCTDNVAIDFYHTHVKVTWPIGTEMPEMVSITITDKRDEVLTVSIPVKRVLPDFSLETEKSAK